MRGTSLRLWAQPLEREKRRRVVAGERWDGGLVSFAECYEGLLWCSLGRRCLGYKEATNNAQVCACGPVAVRTRPHHRQVSRAANACESWPIAAQGEGQAHRTRWTRIIRGALRTDEADAGGEGLKEPAAGGTAARESSSR